MAGESGTGCWCADKQGRGVRLRRAAKGMQVAMSRPCPKTKRRQVGKSDASLDPTRRRTEAGETSNKMGRRFRGIRQRSRTKVGDLGGRQERMADGRSQICEGSDGARRRRSQLRNSALFIVYEGFPGATAAFFPTILRGPDFPTWEP